MQLVTLTILLLSAFTPDSDLFRSLDRVYAQVATPTFTPTPSTTLVGHRLVAGLRESAENKFRGGSARMWLSYPQLRWPGKSYQGIWITGDPSLPYHLRTPVYPPFAATPTPGEHPPTLTPTTSPLASPSAIPTASPWPPETGNRGDTWIEAGFGLTSFPELVDDLTNPLFEYIACQRVALWSTGGPHAAKGQFAFYPSTTVYDVKVYRTDIHPGSGSPPPNPNPTTPLWTVTFAKPEPATGKFVIVYEKYDINPWMEYGDMLQIGGEVDTVWPLDHEDMPETDQFNDLGRSLFSRLKWAWKSGQSGATYWEVWKSGRRVLDHGQYCHLCPSDYDPLEGKRTFNYEVVYDVHQLDPDGGRPFYVDGYNGEDVDGTWQSCVCDILGGRLPCVTGMPWGPAPYYP